MKHRIKQVAILTLIALGALAVSAPSVAWTRTVYRVYGDTASAQLSGSTSCVNLNINVSGSEKMTRDGGSRTPTVGVWASVSGFDVCNGYFVDGGMLVPAATFSGQLSWARASAGFAVNLYQLIEVDGAWVRIDVGTVPVQMDLVWTGSGITYTSRTFETNSSPTGVIRNRYAGRWQEASVTASVMYNGEGVAVTDSTGTTGTFISGTTEVIRY